MWRPIWRKVEFASVTAIAVTLLFVVIGEGVEQIASRSNDDIAQAPKANPQFNAIDYAATGSTKIVIGPCDTRKP